MKNIVKRSLLLVLTSLCVVSCGNKNNNEYSSSEINRKIDDKYIVENGMSDYYIVVPDSTNDKVGLAASELSSYLAYSSGCNIDIVKSKDLKKKSHYISLGNTSQFQDNILDVNVDSLKGTYSAYFITTRDDNIYINSNVNGSGEGTLYGVYDFLNDLIDYNYYFEDEIYYKKSKTLNLLSYEDEFVFPSFDQRGIGTSYFTNHDMHNTKSRLINTYKGKEWCSHLYGHGQIRCFVNPNEVLPNGKTLCQEHPDWFVNYNAGALGNQLCWTGGEELINLVTNKMIEYIEQYPLATYFMFGQEDNKLACNCDRCKQAMEQHACNHAGLQIEFMNQVIEKCENWLSKNQPGREIQYVIYAYYATKSAPVKIDSNGEFIPFSDKVIPHKNLRIFYAPIECNFGFPLSSPINDETLLVLKQWSKIAYGQIIMYLYDTNFTNYWVNFNNFGTVTEMYRTCRDYGVSYMYTQGAMDAYIPAFDEMRGYVESNLMWNLDLNYEDLVQDFMNHYYKEASIYMHNIYTDLRDQYTYYQCALEPSSGSIYGQITNSKLYPAAFIRKLDGYYTEAVKALEPLKENDPNTYQTVYNRIMKEYLSIIYIKMSLYRSYYSQEQINEMHDIFDYYTVYYGLNKFNEGGMLDNLF